MSEFKKYMHVERFGTAEVESIEQGKCFVFPKIDGTNASIWLNKNGEICAGSRNRQLSLEKDNADFCDFVYSDNAFHILAFLQDNPHLRLYGEWLVPHTLRTYREDAWRKFYVFDVYNNNEERHISFDKYSGMLEDYGIEYIKPISVIINPDVEKLIELVDANSYLIKEGGGAGEGIVIKNYDFKNKYGRTTWAKIVRQEFKTQSKTKNISNLTDEVELKIVEEFVTSVLVDKTYAKLAIEGWNSKMIPRLLQAVYYDLVTEEIWSMLKKFKSPRIDFKRLNSLTMKKIKELKPELF